MAQMTDSQFTMYIEYSKCKGSVPGLKVPTPQEIDQHNESFLLGMQSDYIKSLEVQVKQLQTEISILTVKNEELQNRNKFWETFSIILHYASTRIQV